jgi:SAM-dependent methyltransferase
MPSISENISSWNSYNWARGGHEWSDPWGTAERQWQITVYPRIQAALERHHRVLEIGPGLGRWTERLLRHIHHLDVVDVAEKVLAGLSETLLDRLPDNVKSRVSVHLNDGKTLPVENESIDFLFSFDSLVHADLDVLDAYIQESARILHRTEGLGFIHHANMPGTRHWRGTATANSVLASCQKANLYCYVQELTPWVHEQNGPLDCFTFFGTQPREPYKRLTTNVLDEANYAKRLVALYG